MTQLPAGPRGKGPLNLTAPEADALPLHRDGYHRPDQPEIRPGLGVCGTAAPAVPSLRATRRTLVLACLGFTIGMLLVLMSGPCRNEFLAPGPLASSHAQILGGLEGKRCAACHEQGDTQITNWLTGDWSRAARAGQASCQSELCLKCHAQGLGTSFAMQAHGLEPQALAKSTSRIQMIVGGNSSHLVPTSNTSAKTDLACSTCHREHHGDSGLAAQLSDAQCQSCHVRRFQRFDLDHPAFVIAGGTGSSGILFDHASHGSKHFASAGREFNCKSCHPADPTGNVRTHVPFAVACASCHEPAIQESQRSGLELLALPMLDTEALRRAGLEIRDWPVAASGDFDGDLPPLMRMMLAADPEVATDLKRLPERFSFSRLDPSKPEDLQLAFRLAGGITRLMAAVGQSGREAIETRLQSVLESPTANGDAFRQQLQSLLPDNPTLKQTVREWMPQLNQDRNQIPSPSMGAATTPRTGQLNQSQGEPLFRLRPASTLTDELLAQNPLAGMFSSDPPARESVNSTDPSGPAKSLPQQQPQGSVSAARPLPAEQLVGGQESSSRPPSDSDTNWQTDESAAIPAANAGGEWLAGNPVAALGLSPKDTSQPRPNQSASSELQTVGKQLAEDLADRPPQGNIDSSLTANRSELMPAASFSDPLTDPPASPFGEDWVRNDQLFVLQRKPAGHADLWTKNWLQLIASAVGSGEQPSRPGFSRETFFSVTAPGQCALCHVAASSGFRGTIPLASEAWRSALRDPAVREMTRFNHQPHVIVRECVDCHQLASPEERTPLPSLQRPAALTVSWQKNGSTGAAGAYHSGLRGMTPADCATCHRPQASPVGCTTCHNYHIHSPPPSAASQR